MPKILLVEDDPSIARMLIRILTLGGHYEAVHAAEGKTGLELALSISPDLILLDIMMPEMNGMEVLDALKANATVSHIPVLMMTNLGSEQNAHLALEKGAVDYVVKSDVDPQEVLATIQKYLQPLPTPSN